MSLWDWLFNPAGLTAHGFCLSWAPGLIGLHAISDAVIGLSYFSIPLALAWFVRSRRDLQYQWVVYLFAAFILACGATHLFSILTLWTPVYGLEGVVKALTAVLSVATAAALWPLVPRLVALPSPAQLGALNIELSDRVAAQERTAALLRETEARVRGANAALEQRVVDRTADLMAANTRLTAALEQRDLLLREVYHRVKNNLQTVDSLLLLQARKLSDPEASQALTNLRGRVYALGLVHNQLMGSEDLRTFDIAPFLKELSANILLSGDHAGVDLSVEAAPLKVGLDIAIPLGLLVTELVTNALKHAFPDGVGEISVRVEREAGGDMVLFVGDNGRGFSGAEDSQAGLGMGIVRGLAAQLEGTIAVANQDGVKTEIRIPARVAT